MKLYPIIFLSLLIIALEQISNANVLGCKGKNCWEVEMNNTGSQSDSDGNEELTSSESVHGGDKRPMGRGKHHNRNHKKKNISPGKLNNKINMKDKLVIWISIATIICVIGIVIICLGCMLMFWFFKKGKISAFTITDIENVFALFEKKRKKSADSETITKDQIACREHAYATLESRNVKVARNDLIRAHYEMSDDFIHNANDHDYDELHWKSISQEEELMTKLSKIQVPIIPTNDIELKECLGSGHFGTVHRGLWRVSREKEDSEPDTEGIAEVAVKSLGSEVNEEERLHFLKEAVTMGQFDHTGILRVFGIVMNPEDPATVKIVMEMMHKGDLRHHLISMRPEEDQEPSKELEATLLSYTRQIAYGVMYLATKKYIHRDLAARNVLVSEDGICKIGDFGLSHSLGDHDDYYVFEGGKIPVKWTAPEALHYRKYSTASDVWSYGCLLYEIWSLGYKPFHNEANDQVLQKMTPYSGYRLPPPPGCPRSIYQLMIKCWHPDPTKRTPTCNLLTDLQYPDFQILKWTQSDVVACTSMKAKVLGSSLEEGSSLYKDLQQIYNCSTNASN